jgi:hypothetical protein
MTRRFQDEPPRKQEVASTGFTQLLFVAYGVAGLLGLLCGVVWVAYQLLRHYFFQ